MIKPLPFAFAAAIAAVSLAGSAQAQTYENNGSTVEVMPALQLKGGPKDLYFGKIVLDPYGSDATITVQPDSTYTATGVLVMVRPPNAAQVLVAGAPNAQVRVTLPSGPLKLARVSGSFASTIQELDLTDLTLIPGEVFNFDSSGSETSIFIGGKLTIPAQSAGIYYLKIPVTFSYE